MQAQVLESEQLDPDGFLRDLANWSRELAEELAARNDLGPLGEDHWRIIEFVRGYYREHGEGPAVVKIGRALELSPSRICTLFPCGVARGAYRLAGLPRPAGCL